MTQVMTTSAAPREARCLPPAEEAESPGQSATVRHIDPYRQVATPTQLARHLGTRSRTTGGVSFRPRADVARSSRRANRRVETYVELGG